MHARTKQWRRAADARWTARCRRILAVEQRWYRQWMLTSAYAHQRPCGYQRRLRPMTVTAAVAQADAILPEFVRVEMANADDFEGYIAHLARIRRDNMKRFSRGWFANPRSRRYGFHSGLSKLTLGERRFWDVPLDSSDWS